MSYQSLTMVSQDSMWCQWGLFLSMCSCQEASCTRGSERLRVLPCRPARRFHFQPVQPAQRYQPGPERRQTDRQRVSQEDMNWTELDTRWISDVVCLEFDLHTHTHTGGLSEAAYLRHYCVKSLSVSPHCYYSFHRWAELAAAQKHRQTPIIWIHPVHQCLTSRAADKRVILALK